jgi:hypothetical protein
MPQQPPQTTQTYYSYLLRLWREGDGQRWRASLQSAATEETQHFPHVEALLVFLCRHLGMTLTVVPSQGATQEQQAELAQNVDL